MANKQLQLRRGDASSHNSFTGAPGEVTVNTTNNSVHVHDGSTAGGAELARADLSNRPAIALDLQSQKITNLATPTQAADAANKGYVDAQIGGGAVALEYITGMSLTSNTLTDISDADMLLFSSGKVTNVTLVGDVTIDVNGNTTIGSGVVDNAMLASSDISVNGSSVSLGSGFTIEGTTDELSVATVGSTLTLGLPDNVVVTSQLSAASLSTSGNASIGGDLSVTGNLTVSGGVTSVSSNEVNVGDAIIKLNSDIGAGDTPTEDAGIEVARGNADNANLLWNESTDKWGVQITGSTFYALHHKGVALVGSDLADGAIDSAQIANGAVDNVHLAGGITQDKLDGGILASQLAGSIGSDKLSDFADSLANTAGHILVGTGTTIDALETAGDIDVSATANTLSLSIGSAVIDTSHISASAGITGSQLANATIGTTQLSDSAVTEAKLADSSVVNAKLVDSTITNAKLAGGITADKLVTGILGAYSTDDLPEGSNLYYTDGRAVAAVTASAGDVHGLFAGGDNITRTGGTFSLDSSITLGTVTAQVIGNVTGDITGNVVGNVTGNLTGDVTGTVSDLSNHTTSDLSEGSNLYFTDARAVSAVTASAGDVHGLFAGGDNITLTNGTFSLDSSITLGTVTAQVIGNVTGDITGNVTGDLTGNVTGNVTGDLTGNVTGDLTGNVTGTVSSLANHDTADLAEGANLYFTDARAKAVLSAGDNIVVTGGTISTSTTINAAFVGNLTGDVTGTVSSLSNHDTADLAEGTNLYFTEQRVKDVLTAGTNISITGGTISTLGAITADVTGDVTGNVTGNVTGTVSSIANHSTTDLSEGTNLYYTDQRVKDVLVAGTNISITGGTISTLGTIAADVTGDLTGNVTGTVSSISNHTTTDLAEGTNLYFTDARAKAVLTAGSNISIVGGTIATLGTITADVTGDLTGNVTGNVTGDVTGDLTGNVTAGVVSVSSTFSLSTADFIIDAISMTASATELNFLDGATAGTAVASKAVVLDANKDVSGVRKITLYNAEADADALTVTDGNVTIAQGDLVITSGNLSVNSKLQVGPGSSITSQTDEMRFEDSLLQLNYSSGKDLLDDPASGRVGGLWLRADEDTNGTATGIFVDASSEWHFTKAHNDPTSNNLANLSSQSHADIHVGGLETRSGVVHGVTTLTGTGSSTFTLDATHHIVALNVDTISGDVVNIPAASSHAGREYVLLNEGLSSEVTYTFSGSDLNDTGPSAPSSSLTSYDRSITLVSSGTYWYVK